MTKKVRIRIEPGAKTCLHPGEYTVIDEGAHSPYVYVLPNGGIIFVERDQVELI